MIVHHKKVKFFLALLLVYCRNQHTAGVNAHHISRRKIYYCDSRLADKLLRLIVGVDTAEDRSVLACSVVKSKLKKLLALFNSNAVLDLDSTEIGL